MIYDLSRRPIIAGGLITPVTPVLPDPMSRSSDDNLTWSQTIYKNNPGARHDISENQFLIC